MRSTLAALALTATLAALQPSAAHAQEPRSSVPSVVEIELRDGSKLYATVISEDASRMVVRTVAGADVTLTRDQIRFIYKTAGAAVNGEFWTQDAVTSKLFLGPTGRSLRRGEAYMAIDSLFLPSFQVGVTDRFSIGVGLPLYGFVKTAYITPKLQVFETDRFAVSTGVLHLFVPDFGLGGYGYVVATRGTADNSVTFGGGALYGRDDDGSGAIPMLTIGGEHRTGRRTKLVTESYIFKEGVIASVGTRFLGQTVSTELGVIVTVVDNNAPLPGFFINFVIHGRPRR